MEMHTELQTAWHIQKANENTYAGLLPFHLMAGRTWRPAQHRGAGGCSERRLWWGSGFWRLIAVSLLPMCLANMHAGHGVTRPNKPKAQNNALRDRRQPVHSSIK